MRFVSSVAFLLASVSAASLLAAAAAVAAETADDNDLALEAGLLPLLGVASDLLAAEGVEFSLWVLVIMRPAAGGGRPPPPMPVARFLATDEEGMELCRRDPGVDDDADDDEGREGVSAENAEDNDDTDRGGRRADPPPPADPDARDRNWGGRFLPPLPLARTAAAS